MTAPLPTQYSSSPTILVVDDTPTNLSVLVGILQGHGYRILVARNGQSAIEIARRTQPDVMLLDVVMPGLNGFDVCRELRYHPAVSETIVIFLSALGDVSDKVTGLELGAVDYITKPYQSEEVLARVRGHLIRKQLERDLRISRDSLNEELRSAGEMQRMLLPQALPAHSRVSFAAHYRTSLHAGGDYYDVFPLNGDRVGVFVADVSGHGAKAAIIMAMMRTLLHSSEIPLEDPGQVLRSLNLHFSYLKETSLFATALYALIDPTDETLRIACAGHPTPLLLRNTLSITTVECDATVPLFMFDLPNVPVSEHKLSRGDRIIFYTDGFTERQTEAGEMFGFQRLRDAIAREATDIPEQLLRKVIETVESFADGHEPDDDQTMLIASLRQ